MLTGLSIPCKHTHQLKTWVIMVKLFWVLTWEITVCSWLCIYCYDIVCYTVAFVHAPDVEGVLSVFRILTNKEVEVFDLKIDRNGSYLTKKREDLRILYLVNCILDVSLSIAASVIAFLLLLSGDIEENPGPGGIQMKLLSIDLGHKLMYTIWITDLDYDSVDATNVLSKSSHYKYC